MATKKSGRIYNYHHKLLLTSGKDLRFIQDRIIHGQSFKIF